ncbi:MAG: hypothetical protein H6Q13_2457 [Bacteroidetes bacterium]|nr:hypothetical protein [Bacteroidota bacterium]
MEIVRLISWFERKSDKLVGDYNIDDVDFEILKSIVKPKKEDPLMYYPYTMNKKQISKLKQFINIEFDLENYVYEIGCFQILE